MNFFIPQYKKTWLTFFDILGFKSLFEGSDTENKLYLIVEKYHETLRELKGKCSYYKGSERIYTWFSDSFLIYTKDGSEKSYVLIQQASKHFLESNIYIRVPLRGTTSYGDLYMDEENSIFLGHSLIEAYTYCEDQDWINIILNPSATIKAQEMGFTPSHHSFTNKNIKLKNESNENVFAYTFCSGEVNFDSPLIPVLTEMMLSAPEEAKNKYQNTLDHIKLFWKKII